MKTHCLLFFCSIVIHFANAQNTDLPGPVPNLQTIATGSYVIAMDNTLQVNSSGDFNLKAYGLIVYLLNNNVRIKWSIRSGKVKDAIDFSAQAEQVKPSFVAVASHDFKSGPFIINAPDTAGVSSLIDAFYTSNSLTGANRPQVYRLTADIPNVDIRYDLTAFRPKAAVLNDGGNQNIHLAYMTACGIPSESYATSSGSNLIANCFTFASEPHNTNSGTSVDNAIIAIKDFVAQGGNFLAQCEAINNYENNIHGHFQTTSGITVSNANIGTTVLFPNPDLSFCQFEGVYNASLGGSLKNWKIVGSAANSEHNFAIGTGSNSNVIGASASKLYYPKGGLVFYVGNHSFPTNSLAGINGIRMYMNAFLTPSNTNCPSQLFFVLPLKLISFSGNLNGRKSSFKWKVAENESANRFDVEQSFDGQNFLLCGTVKASVKTGEEQYNFSCNHPGGKMFYRLKMVDKSKKVYYSNVLVLNLNEVSFISHLRVLHNPVKEEDLAFDFIARHNSILVITVYNSYGVACFKTKYNSLAGVNQIVIPGSEIRAKGSYMVEVTDVYNYHYISRVLKL
jgi:hypothetical protein